MAPIYAEKKLFSNKSAICYKFRFFCFVCLEWSVVSKTPLIYSGSSVNVAAVCSKNQTQLKMSAIVDCEKNRLASNKCVNHHKAKTRLVIEKIVFGPRRVFSASLHVVVSPHVCVSHSVRLSYSCCLLLLFVVWLCLLFFLRFSATFFFVCVPYTYEARL